MTITAEPEIRRATPDDAEACHEVMWSSVTDFGERHGTPLQGTAAEWWRSGEPLHRFLAEHAAEWWVAVAPDTGTPVGYARSIERGGLFELTEFFVVPTSQSRGVGRALIERAFPFGRGDIRSIIATTDVRALTRYYAAGTVARFPMLTLVGAPRDDAEIATDLSPHRLDLGSESDRRDLRELDRSVLEYPREESEIHWLLEEREGYLYARDGQVIGFAFVGKAGSGPIARARSDRSPERPPPRRGARERDRSRVPRPSGAGAQRGRDASLAEPRLPRGSVGEPLVVEPTLRSVRPVHPVRPTDLPVGPLGATAVDSVAPRFLALDHDAAQ
jgi:GNAT superfamily N-acetyltransferase